MKKVYCRWSNVKKLWQIKDLETHKHIAFIDDVLLFNTTIRNKKLPSKTKPELVIEGILSDYVNDHVKQIVTEFSNINNKENYKYINNISYKTFGQAFLKPNNIVYIQRAQYKYPDYIIYNFFDETRNCLEDCRDCGEHIDNCICDRFERYNEDGPEEEGEAEHEYILRL